MAPSVKISSASVNTIAAGAKLFLTSCNKTPLPLQDPRELGIKTILSVREDP